MPRRPTLFIALLLMLASALVWRWGCADGDSKASATDPAPSPSHQVHRAKRDWQSMAWALSDLATRPMGLVRVSGHIKDRQSGEPIPNAEVIFTGMGGESSVTSNERGFYQLELKPGLYRSYAYADGYLAVANRAPKRLPEAARRDEVALPKEELAPLVGVFRDQRRVDLALLPAATIRGRILDQQGSAISGAVVYTQGRFDVLGGSDISESDGGGSYELVVPAGTALLAAHHEEYAGTASYLRRQLSPGEEWEQDIVLAEGCIIEGLVVDSEGALVLTGAFEKYISATSSTPIGEIHEGHVRYTQQHAGSVRLRAWPWGHPPSEALEFECSDGAHFRDQVFVVPDAEPSLTGTVVDVDGYEVAQAFVDLFPLEPSGMAQQERADHNGDYQFFRLPDGPVQLSVHHPSKGVGLTVVDVPSSGVRVELSGTGSVTGHLSEALDATLTLEYRCELQLSAEEMARGDRLSMPTQTRLVPVERGFFRIDDVPACPLRGSLSGGDYFSRFAVDVVANRETPVEL